MGDNSVCEPDTDDRSTFEALALRAALLDWRAALSDSYAEFMAFGCTVRFSRTDVVHVYDFEVADVLFGQVYLTLTRIDALCDVLTAARNKDGKYITKAIAKLGGRPCTLGYFATKEWL